MKLIKPENIERGSLYIYEKCYYAPSTLDTYCDHLRVFFPIIVDFKDITIGICKEYYDLLFVNKINNEKIRYYNGVLYTVHVQEIQESIIRDIVNEMFGGFMPSYPSIKINNGSNYGRDSMLGTTNIEVSIRPHMSINVDSLSLFKTIGEIKSNGGSFYLDPELERTAISVAHQTYNYIKQYKKFKKQVVEFEKKMFSERGMRLNYTNPTFSIESALILFEVLTYNKSKKNVTSKQ